MKKTKLLSLFLAGSLLFQTAGATALTVTAAEPAAVTETVDEQTGTSDDEVSDSETSKTPSEEDDETKKPSKEENPDLSDTDSEEGKDTSEEENPNLPSTEEGETKDPSEEENPPLPAPGEGEATDPSEEDTANPPAAGEEKPVTPPEEENPDLPAAGDEETVTPPEEENPDLPATEEEDNASSDDNEVDPDETISPEESVSENTISENTLPEEEPEEEEETDFDLFPGLSDSYSLSPQQMEDKETLAFYMKEDHILGNNARNASDYPDKEGIYELGEVIYLADTEAEARQIAKAFGGTLDSYAYKVAVISLPQEATVAMAVAAASDPDVNLPAVWPNYYHYPDSDVTPGNTVYAPKDPAYDKQWQHDYIGTRYAWAAGFKGQGIDVAVIDTGLQMNHEDLSANAVTGRDFVSSSTGDALTTDNGSHGTHVAGIIAADDNSVGGAGIAPDASVRGYCVFDTKGNTGDILRAINAAVSDGNDIINMSLGTAYYNDYFAKAVKAAYDAGVAVFASSGNDDTNANNFPAAYPGAISVGAVDQNSARASFSNYGGTVDLSFPGVGIYSTVPSGYGYMSGTSQASPAAAGTAAVILSADESIRKKTGPAKVDALLTAMKSSTTKCSGSGMGAGTTWLPGVLHIATETAAPDTPEIRIDESKYQKSGNNYIAESVNVTLSASNIVGVELYYTTNGKNPTYKNGEMSANATLYTGGEITLGGAKQVTVKAVALNPITGKLSKAASKSFTLTPLPTKVDITSANNVTRIAAGKSLKLTASVTPSYAVSTKVNWSVSGAAGTTQVSVDSKGNVKTKSTTPGGEYTVTATPLGTNNSPISSLAATFTFTVIEKAEIQKVAFLNGNKAYKTAKLNIGGPDLDLKPFLKVTKLDKSAGDASNVVWVSSNPKVATVTNGSVHALTPGKTTVKAVSNDGGNKSASCTVTVNQPITNIVLSSPVKVAAGKSITLKAEKIEPENASNKKLTWKVSGNSNVTISASGKLTAKKGASGSCTVTATAKDGSPVSASASVSILSGEITKITLSDKKLTLFSPNAATKNAAKAPTTGRLTASVDGKSGCDRSLVTWTSSAPGVASVDKKSGVVTAKTAGKAVITCAATDGSNKKATCTVTVAVPMSKLVIGTTDSYGAWDSSGYYGYIAAGKSVKMSAKYSSNYGTPTNKKVTWTSSKPDVVKVDKNGKVTADKNAAGTTAVITATAADGSQVTSNEFTFNVWPSFKKLTLESVDGSGFTVVGWDENKKGYTIPYYTVSVSGGKNPGLSKQYDKTDKCYYLVPIPGKATTNKSPSAETLYTNDAQKMTLSVKLRDGSGLSAKKTFYVVRFANDLIRWYDPK